MDSLYAFQYHPVIVGSPLGIGCRSEKERNWNLRFGPASIRELKILSNELSK